MVEKGLFIDLKCKLSEDKANQDRFNAIIERDRELSMAARQYDHNLELERVEHQKQVQENTQSKQAQDLYSIPRTQARNHSG